MVRDRKVASRRAKLFALISRGQELQRKAPTPQNQPGLDAWYQTVQRWSAEAATVLMAYSPQAVTTFVQSGSRYFQYANVADGAQRTYNELLAKLENLRGIMEKPDAYY